MKTPRRARSMKARVAPPAESWLQAIPSRSTPSQAPGRKAERNPTKGPARRQQLRREEIPTLAQAAVLRRRVVAGARAVVVRPAEAPAPWARRVVVHPKPAPEALTSHPSSAHPAAQPALRLVLVAAAVASKVAAGAARPTFARQPEWVRMPELPRSERQPEVAAAGHQRPGRRPRREPARRQGSATTQERASPSSARFPEEPRQLGQQGSGRALRRAAPTWSQSLPDEKPLQFVVGMAGARVARSALACAAYV
jgi:hypothetical protein